MSETTELLPERVYLPPEVARAMAADGPPDAGDVLYTRAQSPAQAEQVYQTELNLERLVTAVRLALEELNERCHEVAAVQWFQSGYKEAIAKVKDADEGVVFALRKDTPTLTGE